MCTKEHYLAVNNIEILTFPPTYAGLNNITLNEINQVQKLKFCTTSLTWNVKKSTS